MKKLVFAVAVGLAAVLARGDEVTLPEGYEAVFGIASTEGGKQFILTDYVPSSCKIKIEAKVTLTKYSTQGIWCSRMGTTDRTMTLFCWAASNYFRLDRNASTSVNAKKAAAIGVPVTLVGDYKNLTFSIDGEDCGQKMAGGDFTPASKLGFFASHTNGSGLDNYALMTLHGVKIYDADGNLEREYVPVRCVANAGKYNEYGLYELKKDGFCSNKSSSSKAFVPVEESSCSWTEDTATDSLIITVEKGVYLMTEADAARITGTTHANLVKRGAGTAVGMPIQDFTGNITIEEGIFRLAHQYDCGADTGGWIRVCDGATLEVNGFAGVTNPRAITGKTIYTTGTGVGGMGAIAGGCNWNSCSACRFILEGDSLYRATSEFAFINYIDLAGHKLTGMQTKVDQRWGLSSATVITNSATTAAEFYFTNGLLRVEGSGTGFKGNATDGKVCIRGGKPNGTVVLATTMLSSKWPVEIGPNVLYESRKFSNHSDLTQGGLEGPLTFKGHVELATTVQSGTNSLANIKGTMTGGGDILIGSGWVNFQTTANDYAGTITAARSNALDDDDFRAGIRVLPGMVYSAAETILTNADFEVGNGVVEVKSPLHFTGDEQSRLTGGTYSGERTKLGLIRKTGSGELLLSAGVTVTGRLEVAEGKVRFPSRTEYLPVMGKPGLMGSVTNEACWSFTSPDKGGIPCVYDTVYPHGNDLTVTWSTMGSRIKGPCTTMVRGYLWNRTGANVTWSFLPHHVDRVWFWLDGEQIFSNTQKDTDVATRTLTPGPHEYVLITTSSATSYGGEYLTWESGKGSIYASLPIDFQGRGTKTASNYSIAYDPGDGSLFTVDDKTIDEITDPFWLAKVETAAFGPTAIFDVSGYDYRVETLEGCPTVTDVGTLTVGRKWLLTEECIVIQKALTVSGTLAFAEGCELDLAVDLDKALAATCQAFDAGVTIASATALNGMPTLSAGLVRRGATLSVSDDGKSLVLRVPNNRYVKSTATGAAVGYTVSAGKPHKEVRIDVYRDGTLIDQRFLGDAYGLCEGAWTYEGDGYYLVFATTRTEDAEERQAFGATMNEGANIRYVSPGESIIAAVAALGADGGKVYVRPGTYEETMTTSNGVWLTAAVQVIGLTDDPTAVVVTRDASYKSRIFTLNHKDAAIRFLTVTGGELAAAMNGVTVEGNGGNVFVSSKGGTVENCILLNGSTEPAWSAGGGNIALWGGRMANCRLVGGKCNTTAGVNQWVQCGSSVFAKSADGSTVVIENCFITGAGQTTGRDGGAPVAIYNNVRMVNCTIADSVGTRAGGVALFKTAKGGTLPQVVNCAFYNNRTLATDVTEKPYKNVYASILCYRASTDNGITDEEAAAAFVNCASAETINDTCIKTDAPLFVDAANGDYRLQAESPLVKAGVLTASYGAMCLTDLIGTPHNAKKPSIGCYEYREPKLKSTSLTILVR